jgi:hypothetical protein
MCLCCLLRPYPILEPYFCMLHHAVTTGYKYCKSKFSENRQLAKQLMLSNKSMSTNAHQPSDSPGTLASTTL